MSVDEVLSSSLKQKTNVVTEIAQVFEQEHALEVQLPFIQKTFPKAKIVPIIVGEINLKQSEQLAVALNELIGKREDVLVLVSSDMSHYLPYDDNNAKDERTLNAVKHQDIESFWNGNINHDMEMCGFFPVVVAI